MILAGYRYNVEHAEEPAEENSNEAVHTEPSDDA
jgi:hypothetical protein